MIICAHCKEQLSTYLDGTITTEEQERIEEHLSTCEQCRAVLSELKKTRETLRNLEEIEPPPWFTQKVMNRVRQEAVRKKGLFQKLFYPFHVKIPIEAFAACLVVVLALFIYKNIEPEMKALHEPDKIATVSPQDQAQKQSERAPAVPTSKELPEKSDDISKGNMEQQRNAITPSVFDSKGAGGSQKKDSPSPAGVPERLMAEKSFEGTGSSYEAKTGDAAALKKEEAMSAQKAVAAPVVKQKEESARPSVGSAPVKETQEAMKTATAREIQARSFMESKQVLFTVLTNTIEATAKETENLLNRFGAKNINRTSRQPRSISFDADLPGQKVTEFFNALKSVGDVKEKRIPARSPEDYLAVRIEITGNP
jgi:hypothetical protein